MDASTDGSIVTTQVSPFYGPHLLWHYLQVLSLQVSISMLRVPPKASASPTWTSSTSQGQMQQPVGNVPGSVTKRLTEMCGEDMGPEQTELSKTMSNPWGGSV